MKKTFLSLAVSLLTIGGYAQEVTVFESGNDGYASYRIPAIVKGQNGDLIAFAEGRVDHAGDYGNVDIVYKISKRRLTSMRMAVEHGLNDMQTNYVHSTIRSLESYPEADLPD